MARTVDEDVFEHLPCAYVATSRDGTLTRVNGKLLSLVGYAREDLIGSKRLSDLFTVGGRIFYETHFAPLLEMQGFVEQVAMDLRTASGASVPVLLNAVRRTDAAGVTTEIHTTLVDVSDRKSYERELLAARRKAEAAAQAKTDFVSMISHEIRTPLSAIMGVAHLLESTGVSPRQTKYLSILRRSSDNLLRLVNDVLDFSKIEAGKLMLEERRVDLRALVGDVAQAFEPSASTKKLSIEVVVDDAVPQFVVGDPVKLGQVMTNLVSNAVKFTSEGKITVRVGVVERSADRVTVQLRVTDTGIGIPQARLAAIFDDFAQGGYDIGAQYGGTGLGLAIVRRLVELHGGRIHVDSVPDAGATFWFELTLRELGDDEHIEGDEVEAPHESMRPRGSGEGADDGLPRRSDGPPDGEHGRLRGSTRHSRARRRSV